MRFVRQYQHPSSGSQRLDLAPLIGCPSSSCLTPSGHVFFVQISTDQSQSMQIVNSLKQYHRVVSHGLSLFCALLRTRIATDITLLDFNKAFFTKERTLCRRLWRVYFHTRLDAMLFQMPPGVPGDTSADSCLGPKAITHGQS